MYRNAYVAVFCMFIVHDVVNDFDEIINLPQNNLHMIWTFFSEEFEM